MKKFMSISLASAIIAASFAFAPKAKYVDSWTLYTGQVVQGTAAFIKSTYCSGPDTRVCALKVGGTQVIMRP